MPRRRQQGRSSRAQELNDKLARLEEINRELGVKSDEVEFNVTAAENADPDEEESTRRQSISDRDVLRMAAEEINVDSLTPGEQGRAADLQRAV